MTSHSDDTLVNLDDTLKNQDDDLELLYQGVNRMKNTANKIGNELVSQNQIIVDLSNKTDDTQQKIRNNINKLNNLESTNKSNCGYIYIVVIVLLLLILIILISIP